VYVKPRGLEIFDKVQISANYTQLIASSTKYLYGCSEIDDMHVPPHHRGLLSALLEMSNGAEVREPDCDKGFMLPTSISSISSAFDRFMEVNPASLYPYQGSSCDSYVSVPVLLDVVSSRNQ
jgi:hypothetical protein